MNASADLRSAKRLAMIPALTILDFGFRHWDGFKAIRHWGGFKEIAILDCRRRPDPESRFPERAIRSGHRAACRNLIVALLVGIVLWANQGFAQQPGAFLSSDAGYS